MVHPVLNSALTSTSTACQHALSIQSLQSVIQSFLPFDSVVATLRINSAWRPRNIAYLKPYLRDQGHISGIALSKIRARLNTGVHEVLAGMPQLRTLDLSSSGVLKKDEIPLGDDGTVWNAVFASMPHLRSLNLAQRADPRLDDIISAASTQCPSLVDLNMERCRGISDNLLIKMIPALTQLRHFSLSRSRNHVLFDNGTLLKMLAPLQHLEHLNLSYYQFLDDATLGLILQPLMQLRSLDLSLVSHVTTGFLAKELPRHTHLEYLDLSVWTQLEDRLLGDILPCLPRLAHLSFYLSNPLAEDLLLKIRPHIGTLRSWNLGPSHEGSLLQVLPHLQQLEKLNLHHANVSDRMLTTLLPSLEQLRFLDLTGCIERGLIDEWQIAKFIYRFRDRIAVTCTGWLVENMINTIVARPQSSLGKFYQAVQRAAVLEESDPHHLRSLFSQLAQEDQTWICHRLWQMKGRPMEERWGETHLLDDMRYLYRMVGSLIDKKLWDLSHGRNEVFGLVYELAGSPQTDDFQWGEHHYQRQLCILADALDKFASGYKESKRSS
jgi:hypothetical protein